MPVGSSFSDAYASLHLAAWPFPHGNRDKGATVFTPPAMTSEVVRERQRELVARAERYRLGRSVNHPSTQSRWSRVRSSLARWLVSRAPSGSDSPMRGYLNVDEHISSLDASERGLTVVDLVPHRPHEGVTP